MTSERIEPEIADNIAARMPNPDAPLPPSELRQLPATFKKWKLVDDRLTRGFEFRDFRAAFVFMTSVAFEAEELGHHPEWTNVYNEVVIRLTTHHSGNKITLKDLQLARRIEVVAREQGVNK